MGMATGGRVPHIAHQQHAMRVMPRSEPTFGHVLQAAGLRKYNNGGAVRPVALHGRPRTAYAQGGLVDAAGKVQDAGRFGDSMVVHLNDQEFQELQAKHGAPHINPQTGLPEFFSLGKLLGILAPIAALAIPGIGEVLAPALMGLGIGGTTAGILSSALVGGAFGAGSAALTGANPIKGALIGGVTGGLGTAVGPSLSSGLESLGVGTQTANALVNAGLGAGGSAAAGGNPLTGAIMAGGLSYLAPGITSKIQGLGSITPNGAAGDLSNAVSNATTGAMPAGSDAGIAASTLPDGTLASDSVSAPSAVAAPAAPGAAGAAGSSSSLMSKALPALMMLSLAGGLSGPKSPSVQTTPPPASNAPGYFNQPLTPSPYAPQVNADALRMLLQNPGAYASQGGPGYYQQGTSGIHFAKGGALQQAAQHISSPSPAARMAVIRGAGDGQSDDIDAKLADNEHVIDALTVAAAGRGSSEAGHKRIEKWKSDVRRAAGIKDSKKAPMMKEGALTTAFRGSRK